MIGHDVAVGRNDEARSHAPLNGWLLVGLCAGWKLEREGNLSAARPLRHQLAFGGDVYYRIGLNDAYPSKEKLDQDREIGQRHRRRCSFRLRHGDSALLECHGGNAYGGGKRSGRCNCLKLY